MKYVAPFVLAANILGCGGGDDPDDPPVNNPPVVQNIQNQTVQEGNNLSLDLNDYISDPDGDNLDVEQISGPGSITGNQFTYDDPLDDDNQNDNHTVEFRVTDGSHDITSSFSLTQQDNYSNQINAVDDNFTVSEDSVSNSLSVLDNDSSSNNDHFIESVGSANNGTVVIQGDNLVYTPNSDFFGQENIPYTIQNGQGKSDNATVTLTVQNINDAPSITSNPLEEVVVGENYNYDVNAVDIDSSVIFSLTNAPGWMNINSVTGLISGTPNNTGVVDGTVEATDGSLTDTQNFSFLVKSNVENLTNKKHGVIIAPQSRISLYDPLVSLRRRKGLMFEKVSIESILGDPEFNSGRDDIEKRRMFLQKRSRDYPEFKFAVLDNNLPLRKVLFIGELIPTILYDSDTDDGTGQFSPAYNWDANGNSQFGELADGLELRPDLCVSIFPSNVTNCINNITEYETDPDISKLESMLMMASFLDSLTDTSENADLMIVNYIPAHFSVDTRFERDSNLSKIIALDRWNTSPAIVNIDGHGEYFAIGVGSGIIYPATAENLLREDVDLSLTNNLIPCLVYNASCNTAAVDDGIRDYWYTQPISEQEFDQRAETSGWIASRSAVMEKKWHPYWFCKELTLYQTLWNLVRLS